MTLHLIRAINLVALCFSLNAVAEAQFGEALQVNGATLRGKIAEAGDIDGDGDQDVLVGDALGSIAWRDNLGAGSFGSSQQIFELEHILDLCLADLDGDSDLDLIVVGFDANGIGSVTWFEFLATEKYGAGVTLTTAVICNNSEAADMDGDGDLDILTYDRVTSEIFYFENLGGGNISTIRTRIATESAVYVAAADLDGDGDQDVVAGVIEFSPYGFSLFENEGGGSWTKSIVPNVVPGGRYEGFAFGDLDGDGDLDIVGASRANRFDWYDQVLPMVFRNRQQFYVGSYGLSVDIGDMDADGDLDVLLFGANVDWQENLGGGAFVSHRIEDILGNTGTARLADLDGSGRPDVLYSYPQSNGDTLWKPNLGSGMFGQSESLSVLEMIDPEEVVAADFDGDGDLDVAAISRNDRQTSVWENLGDDEFAGGLRLSDPYTQQIYDVDILATDVDGDGDPDVVVAAREVFWYENQGLFTGAFEPQQILWDGQSRTDRLLAADLNGDGLMDIVGNAPTSREVYVLFGVAGGPDGSAPVSMGTLRWEPMELAAADFDGDGDLDVAALSDFTPALWWIETQPGGTFAPPVWIPDAAGVSNPHSLEAADLDGDGIQDLVAGGLFAASWLRGVGDGTFSTGEYLTSLPSQVRFSSLAVSDVDGDAALDVVATTLALSGPLPDRVYWARNRGMGSFEPGGSFAPDMGYLSGLQAIDFDGDLDNDLLLTSFDENRISVFRNEDGVGAGFCGPAALHSGGMRASIIGSGSTLIADDDLTLQAFDLPLQKAGYFLVSQTQGFVAQPAGSQGNLCLGGGIGRYVQQVGSSGATGTLPLVVQATSITQPQGAVSAMAGEIWSFQCWFRDQVAGANTSNFSSGFAVRFR